MIKGPVKDFFSLEFLSLFLEKSYALDDQHSKKYVKLYVYTNTFF